MPGSFKNRKRAFDLQVTTWAFTFLAPYPGGTVSALCRRRTRHCFSPPPGTGISWTEHRCGTRGGVAARPVCKWMRQVGLRYLLTNHVAMFGEWKLASTTAHFDQVRSLSYIAVEYRAQFSLLGIGYHF